MVNFKIMAGMKRFYIIPAIALAALTSLVSCHKEAEMNSVPAKDGNTFEMTVYAGSTETKTAFGTNTGDGYPIVWSETGEAIKLVEVLTPGEGDPSYTDYTSTGYTLSNSNAKAIFSMDVTEQTTAGTYDYRALYPATAYKSSNLTHSDIYFIIPDNQTATEDSPDPAATVLYAESLGQTEQPHGGIELSFGHLTAYGKMTVKDVQKAFADESETVSSVTISVPAGGYYYYWTDGTLEAVSNMKKDAVTVKTDNLDTSGDFVVWFACAPYSLEVEDELTVSVTTDANTYSRTISLTKAVSFNSGKVSTFSVDMSSASASSDLSGDYIIVSTDGTNPWHVMGTFSSSMYLGTSSGVAATKEIDITDAATDFASFCTDTYVWKLEKMAGGYSLKNASTGKYVSWTSGSGNKAAEVTEAALLQVEDMGNGVFTVKSGIDASRIFQYNYNNGSNPRFVFYTSNQKPLTFIPVSASKTQLATPVVEASADEGTITVTWEKVENATGYTVSCTGQEDQTVATGVGTCTFSDLADGTYTVSVVALGDGETYADSEAGSATVVVTSTGDDTVDVEFIVGTDFTTLEQINSGVTKDGITLSCNTTAYYNPLRVYNKNTITVSAATGKSIVKVVLTGSSSSYIKTWTASDNGDCTVTDNTMTWMSSGIETVTFTQTASAQARITKVTVTYSDGSSSGTTVTTGGTDFVTTGGATLHGSFSGATGKIHDSGFLWGESESSLTNDITIGSQTGTSGAIEYELTGLVASTTYYYQVYIGVLNEETNNVDYYYGDIRSFKTHSADAIVPTGWLELPAYTVDENHGHIGVFYGSGDKVGTNRNYSYNYSYEWYGCLWVAYPLTSSHTSGSASSNWAYNPDISDKNKQVSVTASSDDTSEPTGSYTSNYGNGTYSRGHQIPNADRKSNKQMNAQTYYVTNQTPQIQNKFNGSIWGTLEGDIRTSLGTADTIYVVTGACYRKKGGSETVKTLTAAKEGVHPASLPIPNYYWKVLLKVKRDGDTITEASAIGFWFDHKEYDNNVYTNYAVSVDKIEEYTGIDLFANIPGTPVFTNSSGEEIEAYKNTSWTEFKNFDTKY